MSSAAFSSRLLLIGWDAADWQIITPLIDAGQMPVLAEMIEKGAMGNLATLQPVISPMLWTSIATGKTADKHGIFGFVEKDPETGNARPSSSVSRRAKAIWNIFQQARGWRCHVSNWWASHPAEPLDGITVSNVFFRTKQIGPNTWRVPAHSIHPPELVPEFGPLRMGINEINEHLVLPFIPGAAEIDQKKDHRLERFAALMSDCCSEQAVATALLEREPWQFAAVYFDSIDHFSHGFMAYHPPRQPHISEADFEMYRHVMTGVYRFHDMMLKRLIELAGPEATIVLCSDHGFHSGFLRPFDNPREPAGPIIGHRDFGILVMKGPGIKPDERIYGATLLDIAPTLLTLAGLPIGRDMDGKPLLEILESPTVPVPIDSWEEVAGRDGSHPSGHKWVTSEEDSDEVMRQFAALGYIDDPTVDRREGGESAELEGQYNLSQVYLSTARADEAVSVLENLVSKLPWESRYIHQLANAYLKAGWFRAAEELLQRAYPPSKTDPAPPLVVLQMRVKARLRRGDREGAAHLLSRLMTRMLRHPTTWVEAGWLWIELQRLPEAEKNVFAAPSSWTSTALQAGKDSQPYICIGAKTLRPLMPLWKPFNGCTTCRWRISTSASLSPARNNSMMRWLLFAGSSECVLRWSTRTDGSRRFIHPNVRTVSWRALTEMRRDALAESVRCETRPPVPARKSRGRFRIFHSQRSAGSARKPRAP